MTVAAAPQALANSYRQVSQLPVLAIAAFLAKNLPHNEK